MKFTGAGQGPKALVAEIVVGELGRLLGIAVPEAGADRRAIPEIGRREPDEEVQELVTASAGLNLAIDFLPGAVGYDRSFVGAAARTPPGSSGSTAIVANVDRSARNTNLLIWHKRPVGDRPRRLPALPPRLGCAGRLREPAPTAVATTCWPVAADPRRGTRRAERAGHRRRPWR